MNSPACDREVRLQSRLSDLQGTARSRAECFARLGIHTVSDLLKHLPMRYEWDSAESSIADLPMDAPGTARGTIVATRYVTAMRAGSKPRFEAILEDDGEQLNLVWFNARYLKDRLHPGMTIRVQGKVKAFGGHPQIVNSRWELLDAPDNEPHCGERLRPVYPTTEDLSSGQIASVISDLLPYVLSGLSDPLPIDFVRHREMPVLADAFRQAHLPEHEDEARAARRRLAYNELLLLQLGIAIKRHYNRHVLSAPPLRWNPAVDQHIRNRFPFKLTGAQNQVIGQIASDLQRRCPMNRLLQGDVGAGKTVVALYALLMAVCDRRQGALMAPTEILAEQHFLSITEILKDSTVRIGLLTSGAASVGTLQRKQLLENTEAGAIDIVIGTQALLAETVRFKDLGVVVVDEQHRFGVLQRAAFRGRERGKGGEGAESHQIESPHYLVMTATPIPRTLSLTIFGDLDVSTLRGLPPGRRPVTTHVVGPEKSEAAYGYLAECIANGEQAYVVVPAIGEDGDESGPRLKNVREQTRFLQKKLKGHCVEAIHGQLKHEIRESIMHRFRGGQIHLLVATTVIEVGVDVPNATVMVVEHAERFGLAQLHQLRGRIGRGGDGRRSVCFFIADPATPEALQRMKAIGSTRDGFLIAERDLEIRGMGEFFGTRQSGVPPLRVARLPDDIDLLQMARRDAETIIRDDPKLADVANETLRKILLREYGEAISLIDVG